MRRSQRKTVAWLVLIVMSLSPMAEMFAHDAAMTPSRTSCEIDAAAASHAPTGDVTGAVMDCVQHHACISYCQFTPLQPTSLQQLGAASRLLLTLTDQPDTFLTRFLEELERPPRV